MGKVNKFQNKPKNSPKGKSPENFKKSFKGKNSPKGQNPQSPKFQSPSGPKNGVQKKNQKGKNFPKKPFQKKPFPQKEELKLKAENMDDSDSDISVPENQGVPKFQGTKIAKTLKIVKKPESDDESDDEDILGEPEASEDDDSDDDSEENISMEPKDLLGESLAEHSDEDDGDFSMDSSKEASLGPKDLLGESLNDDDSDIDDDTFVADENDDDSSDSDISGDEAEDNGKKVEVKDAKKVKKVKEEEFNVDDEEKMLRTIFVGNLKVNTTQKELKILFSSFGKVESVRFRGAVGDDPNMTKKVAGITKKYNPKLKSVFAFVVFKRQEDARSATKLNGTTFKNSKLRVSLSTEKGGASYKKAIFLGNLPFEITDDQISEHFAKCGPIESVRAIRDNKSQLGRGFGYVNFKTEDAVKIALELNNSTLAGRQIRVRLNNPAIEPTAQRKNFRISKSSFKKRKAGDSEKKEGGTPKKQKKDNFSGEKASPNKKNKKPNKMNKQKKQMAQKLTAPKKTKNE